MVNNTVYQFVGSNLGVEIFLKKKEQQKKGAWKEKIEASLYTLYWGFKKISFILYRYYKHCVKSVQIRSFFWSIFSRIWNEYGDLRSKSPYSVQIRENTDQKKTPYLDIFCAVKLTPGFKNHMRNFGNFRQAVESLKSQFFLKFVSFFSVMRDHSYVIFYIVETSGIVE